MPSVKVIFSPVPLGIYLLSPVTGATVQEKVDAGSIVELNTISAGMPPEQIVCSRSVLVITGSSLNSNLKKSEDKSLHRVVTDTFI